MSRALPPLSFIVRTHRLRSGVLVATLAAVVACGSSSQVGANATATQVAARAVEPRTNDPTGTSAPTTTASSAIKVGGTTQPAPSAASSGSWSKPPGDSPPEPQTSATDDSANKPANAEPPKRIGARHVLIQWMGSERAPASVVRSREQAYAVAQQVLKRAKAGDDFARLAIEFSDEPGAGGRGGSLGRFGRGQMVGAFEAAAFKLEVGQISDIVESPFGFHIIQRTE